MKSISNKLVNNLLKSLSNNGSDIEKIQKNCGISDYDLSRHHGRISRNNYEILMTVLYQNHKHFLINELVNAPSITLKNFYSTFPELVSYCLSSHTLRELITRYLEFRFVVGSCDNMTLSNNGDITRLLYLDEFLCDKTSYSAMANFLNLFYMMNTLDPNINISVYLTGTHHINKEKLNCAFNTKIKWQSHYNEMWIDNKFLDKKLDSANPNLWEIQKYALKDIENKINMRGNFSFIVESQIRVKIEQHLLVTDKNLLKNICDNLNISRWTLYRKLAHEQTSFSSLLKKVRLDMSLHLLLNSQRSVQEISDLTGFGSPSAFSRFFYSNMGVAPLHYRKDRMT